MARRGTRKGTASLTKLVYSARPIDSVAARVVGVPRKKKRLGVTQAADPAKARKAVETRMTGKRAQERARRAMEAAKWRRENPRG